MKNRVYYLDAMRVFASFAIVILHLSAQNWTTLPVNSAEWQTFNFYDSIVRWGVPVFVMISGALFLDKEVDIKKLFSRNILRLITAYLFWSLIYAIKIGGGVHDILYNTIYGHYHMWFIPMMAGLYMALPFLKKIAENEKTLSYFLAVSFVFAFFVPQVVQTINEFFGGNAVIYTNVLNKVVNDVNFTSVMGYASYFLLGFYLSKKDLKKSLRVASYIIGILAAILTVVPNAHLSLKYSYPVVSYFGNFNLNVLMMSVGIFVFFKYINFKSERINGFIRSLSALSFGTYLCHALVIETLQKYSLHTLTFNPVISVPAIAILVFTISSLISFIISKIPILNKYIV